MVMRVIIAIRRYADIYSLGELCHHALTEAFVNPRTSVTVSACSRSLCRFIRKVPLGKQDGQAQTAQFPCAYRGSTILFVPICRRLQLERDAIDVLMQETAQLLTCVLALPVGLALIAKLLYARLSPIPLPERNWGLFLKTKSFHSRRIRVD